MNSDRLAAATVLALSAVASTAFADGGARPPLEMRPAAAPVVAETPVLPEPVRVAATKAEPAPAVRFDAPGDGALWSMGVNWKMSFGADGATYFPRLGKGAPKLFPLAFSPDRVTVGGAELAFAGASAAARRGDARVELDRGAFVEAYELAPTAVEQLFVFDRLPRAGELVLHLPVATELASAVTERGLEFRSDFGTVEYANGTVVDAHGRRAALVPELVDGAIVLRVSADFLAHAAFPVVVDPVVTLTHIDSTTSDTFSSDVAWDPTEQGWLVVYEQVYSATDTDVYAKFLSSSGAVLLTGTVDFTSTAWHAPRCANLAAAQQFLVVAEVESGLTRSVMGRTIEPSGAIFVQSSQFPVSDGSAGNKVHPDVGGDTYPIEPSYYCVVWEQDVAANDTRIAYRLVNSAAQVSTNVAFMATVPLAPDTTPSISKSNDANEWTIAWTRSDPLYHGDIYAAHVRFDGLLNDGPFGVTSFGLGFDVLPAASSPQHGTRRSLIAFQRRSAVNGNRDVWVTAFDGTTWLSTTNVTALENSGRQGVDQIEPHIDCDGEHFLLSYSENDDFIPTFFDVFVTDLFLAGSTVGIAQGHQILWNFQLSERRSRVSAQHAYSTTSNRYLVMYDFEGNSTDHDVDGALFDARDGGTWSTTCSGDGTSVPCPCGNNGIAGHGCSNSLFADGARLTVSAGTLSTLHDTATLRVENVPNALCLVFQGTTEDPAVVFGDGLRCTSGTLVRLVSRAASANALVYPAAGDPTLSVRGGIPADGGVYSYQVWYRNAASFCSSDTFNASNGVVLNWSR
ncbi:MAG: hypothetical protein U1F29_06760 [Planctomycetota bacterium]